MLTPVLVLVAILVVVAGVVAVAAPNPRHATLGAFAVVVLAAFVDPLPSAAAIVARVAGGVLGGWLVWLSLRKAPPASARATIGWAGTAGAAAAAFAIGWLGAAAFASALATGTADALAPQVPGAALAGGSIACRAAIGASAALAVLAAAPVILPRDGHRLGLGVVLLLAAAGLLVRALSAAPDDTLELAIGLLAAITGAAISGVTASMLGGGDLVLRDALAREPAVRHRPADDAHRSATR